MANPLKSGEDIVSGRGENSSSSPDALSWSDQQAAIQAANMAQQRADTAAVEAAFRRRGPSQKTMSNALDAGDFGIPFTVTDAPLPPTKRVVGKKGK